MENAVDNVTIKGNPSGIDNTIIRKAETTSLKISCNVIREKNFSFNSCISLIMYNYKTINIKVAETHPINTKFFANTVVEFYNGVFNSFSS